MAAGYTQWPFAGGAANATYPQIVLMIAAQKQEQEPEKRVKRKLPKRMWQDWLKRLGHVGT